MLKAGLIGAIAGFIYVTSFNLISPFCTLCITPILGFGVGYLASWFDQPSLQQQAMGRGLIAGGLTSAAVLPGQAIATITSGIIITNLEGWPQSMNELGFGSLVMTDYDYWQATILTNAFCGIFNVGLIVFSAAIGSLAQFQRQQTSNADSKNNEGDV